jgi:hypothetical protein
MQALKLIAETCEAIQVLILSDFFSKETINVEAYLVKEKVNDCQVFVNPLVCPFMHLKAVRDELTFFDHFF